MMKHEGSTGSGFLDGWHLWRASTVPLAIAIILGQTLLPQVARAAQAPQAVLATGAVVPELPQVPQLGTPGLDEPAAGGMQAIGGEIPNLPAVRNTAPRPEEAMVSDPQRAELFARARAEEAHFRPHTDGLRSIHRASQLQLDYGDRGFRVTPFDGGTGLAPDGSARPPAWSVAMETLRIEFDDETIADPTPAAAAAVADARRVQRELAPGCEEWLVNREDRFEHGYTLEDPELPGGAPAKLAVVISVASALELVATDAGIDFRDSSGRTQLSYNHLHVFDATGRELDSAMKLSDEAGELMLEANLVGAVFPITVDPFIVSTVSQIMALGGASGDEFSAAGHGCGDVAAFGSPGDGSGTVRILQENQGGQGNWGEMPVVLAIPLDENPANGDRFGAAVLVLKHEATGQYYIAVGAPNHEGKGSVFIFCRNEGGADNWGHVQTIRDAEIQAGDEFGLKITGQNGVIIIAAPGRGAGAAYFCRLVDGNFAREQKIVTPAQYSPQAGDRFACDLSFGGKHLVIGARGEDEGRGGAYLLRLDDATGLFIFLFRLFSDKAEIGAGFGAVVAMGVLGLILAVGMPWDIVKELGPTELVAAGSVFIYAFIAATLTWTFLTALFGNAAGALFGAALVFNFLKDLVVGATGALTRPGVVAGLAYFFAFNPLTFGFDLPVVIAPSNEFFVDTGMAFATCLVLIGPLLLVGGPAYNGNMGAVFRFAILATVLTFPLWQLQWWPQDFIDANPLLTGPLGDYDGDGIPNLLEFLLFLVPVLANPGFFRGWVADGRFHVPFRQARTVVGALLVLQYTLSLTGSWWATSNGSLGGMFQFTERHRGISANEYVVSIPLIVALFLFVRLNGETVPLAAREQP